MPHTLIEDNPSKSKQIIIVVLIALLLATVSLTSVPGNQMLEDQKEIKNSYANLYSPGYQDGSVFTGSSVAIGDGHMCTIFELGDLKCWGSNSNGQLGTGDTTDSSSPQSVDLGVGRTAMSVAAGAEHTCAILDDASMKCWGSNSNGQLGTGNTEDYISPELVSGTNMYSVVTAGSAHTCAILDDSTIKCWGANSEGQLGIDTTSSQNTPTAVTGGLDVLAISAGGEHTCLITADDLSNSRTTKCWGDNTYGQLGDGTTTSSSSPSWISNSNHVAVSAGKDHTCAILEDGSLNCWGRNNHYQLGIGNSHGTSAQNSPMDVLFLSLIHI